MMLRRLSLATMAALATVLGLHAQAVHAQATAQPADYIVAVVNSEPITNTEVRARVLRAEQTLQQQGRPRPPRAQLAQQVLNDLISEKAQLQYALTLGIRVDELTLVQAEQRVARQNRLDMAQMQSRLARDGITPAQFRETLRTQITLTRLRERELERLAEVSEQDIDQYLREQQSSSAGPVDINLAQLLVAVPENASAEQLRELGQRALRAAERARAGEDFAALVRELSNSPERQQGGLMGLRSSERYPPLFVEATNGRAVGDIVGPVRSGAGFHVLKVVERRRAGAPATTVTQNRARHILLRSGPQMTEAQAIERLNDYRRRVVAATADFAELARQFSQDGSAPRGGELDWAGPGQFVPEFEEALEGLQPGQVSLPVSSRFGFHLIQLLERRETSLTPAQLRDQARAALREKKLDEAYITWAQEVRGRAYVELREPPQ